MTLDISRLQRYDADFADKTDRAVRAVAFAWEAEAKLTIRNSSPAGRTYRRRNVEHRASKAGQPPAIDTGNLINSITVSKVADAHYIGHDQTNYGAVMEFGKRKGKNKIAPRPWAKPSFEKVKRQAPDIIRGVIAP